MFGDIIAASETPESTPSVVTPERASPVTPIDSVGMLEIASVPAEPKEPKAEPMPKPVIPEINPFLRSPSIKAVVRPEPIAPAAAELNPAAPNIPAAPSPVKAELPNIPPKMGAKKGKKASGWPVSGFIVKDPVGDMDASP
tara:strand:+ start:637 stop:1059 length:423 start_codon:yes stop_codon:yes gene_type:complete